MRLIATDKQTARELRQLVQSGPGSVGGALTVSTIASPVIAKIVDAISAGDNSQKTAQLMAIRGGAILSTGQTVRVRNVGSGSVEADTIVLTEPCGKLGQCFVRNETPATPSLISIERYLKFVSQLAPETGLENKTWIQSNGIGTPGFVLHTYWDPLGTPTTIDANGNRIFDYKMNGIRFAIDGHNQPGLWTTFLNQHFTSPNFPVTGKSAVLPGSNSHVLLNLSQVEISNGGFSVLNGWSNAFTTHYRVWIDGVDKTGIVTLGSVFPHTIQLTSVPSRVIGGLLPVSITSGSYIAKSVWFDIWVTVRVVNRTRFHIGDPTLAASYYPACQIDQYAQHHRSRFNSANVNAKRFVGDQYRITFADNGPGGLSTLDVATGDGWTLTETSAGFTIVKAGTASISLNWTTEAPVLTCSIDAKLNMPYAGNNALRYLPAGSVYSHRNNNNTVIDYGEWDPQGSTVFNQVARALGSTYYTKGSSTTPAAFFTGFPSTITVEKL